MPPAPKICFSALIVTRHAKYLLINCYKGTRNSRRKAKPRLHGYWEGADIIQMPVERTAESTFCTFPVMSRGSNQTMPHYRYQAIR
jgi:hypothetical protein